MSNETDLNKCPLQKDKECITPLDKEKYGRDKTTARILNTHHKKEELQELTGTIINLTTDPNGQCILCTNITRSSIVSILDEDSNETLAEQKEHFKNYRILRQLKELESMAIKEIDEFDNSSHYKISDRLIQKISKIMSNFKGMSYSSLAYFLQEKTRKTTRTTTDAGYFIFKISNNMLYRYDSSRYDFFEYSIKEAIYQLEQN